MFNLIKGESMTPKKKWLVVEVITYSETSESRTLSKVADTLEPVSYTHLTLPTTPYV